MIDRICRIVVGCVGSRFRLLLRHFGYGCRASPVALVGRASARQPADAHFGWYSVLTDQILPRMENPAAGRDDRLPSSGWA